VDVLGNRILMRPSDLERSRRFYRDVLGLAIYREFGPPDDPGVVFFLGPGLLEVSGHTTGPAGQSVMIWMQVRDVHAGHARLAAAGIPIIGEHATESWGLTGMWIQDPDGIQTCWPEFRPITLCAATHDRRHHQDDKLYAADPDIRPKRADA
jgi:catechol 2,3-dioxygenase-like lactoylglutathione lyase family enzyme